MGQVKLDTLSSYKLRRKQLVDFKLTVQGLKWPAQEWR